MLRAPDPQPAPQVRTISGSSIWSREDETGQLTRRGDFATTAGADFLEQIAARSKAAATQPHNPLDYAGLAAVVRSAAADHDTAVGIKPLEQDGRSLWRAAMRFDDRLVELVVDQRSGIVQWYAAQVTAPNELPREQFEVTGIDYKAQPAPTASPASGLYIPKIPGGPRYYVTLGAAAEAAGFAPAVSTLAPDGYELAAASVVQSRQLGEVGAAPAKRARRLDLLYVRDLSAFTVSEMESPEAAATRLSAATAGAGLLGYQTAPVQYGLFAGGRAQTWFAPEGPSMLLTGAGSTVLVRGGLTRQELLDLSEGFEQLD